MSRRLPRFAYASLLAMLLLGSGWAPASAQAFVVGGGINGGSIPRAMAPLCSGARRLSGGGLSGSAAFVANRIRLAANIDYVAAGSVSVAGCVPGSGISVDSSFAPADNSAVTLSAAAWLMVVKPVDVGVETGWVKSHSSWFVGPAIGAQYGFLRAEVAGRLHITSFEEITSDFDATPVRVLSRRDLSESSWGLTARILLVTRRR
jgi:hypothetical protein